MACLPRLAAGLIALACLCSVADAAVNKVVHQNGACQKDPDGWCIAKSAEGGFTAILPMAFNDYTITSDGDAVTRTDVVGGGSTDGIRFMVDRLSYKGGAAMAKHYFDKFAGGDTGMGTVVSARRGKVAGHDALDMAMDSAEGRSHVRMVLLDKDVIMMVAFMTAAQEKEHPGAIDQFLNSLRVTRP
jgi:hypothetical protein